MNRINFNFQHTTCWPFNKTNIYQFRAFEEIYLLTHSRSSVQGRSIPTNSSNISGRFQDRVLAGLLQINDMKYHLTLSLLIQ